MTGEGMAQDKVGKVGRGQIMQGLMVMIEILYLFSKQWEAIEVLWRGKVVKSSDLCFEKITGGSVG